MKTKITSQLRLLGTTALTWYVLAITKSQAALVNDGLNNPVYRPTNVSSASSLGLSGAPAIIWNFISRAIGLLRPVLSALAVLYLIYAGTVMILFSGSEDEMKKARYSFLFVLIGFFVINTPEKFIAWVSPIGTNSSGKLVDEGAMQSWFQTYFIDGIQYSIGTVAVIMLLRAGFKWISSQGGEDALKKQSKTIINCISALVLVMMAETYQRVMVSGDALLGTSVILRIMTFLLTYAVPLGVIALIIGGFYLMTSGGDQKKVDKGKTILRGTVIGFIIIFSAYEIVYTFVSWA